MHPLLELIEKDFLDLEEICKLLQFELDQIIGRGDLKVVGFQELLEVSISWVNKVDWEIKDYSKLALEKLIPETLLSKIIDNTKEFNGTEKMILIEIGTKNHSNPVWKSINKKLLK